MAPPELVTRQCGVSSVARHRHLVPAFRTFADEANRMRHCALQFLTFYLTWCANSGTPPVPLTQESTLDKFFALLYRDVPNAPDCLRTAGHHYRTTVSHGFALPPRTGAMKRVAQSFRANISTAVQNLGTQTQGVLPSYLAAHYGLDWHDAKLLAARLGASREDVLEAARAQRRWRLDRALDAVVLELEGNPPPLAARRAQLKGTEAGLRRSLKELENEVFPEPQDPNPAAAAAASAAHAAAVNAALAIGAPLPVGPTRAQLELQAAFDTKYPFSVTAAANEAVHAELLQIWWHEFNRLPATRKDSAALLANRTRMVLACEAAHKRGAPCKLFALGPLPDFACDFVPVDTETLRLFMRECRTGSWGATALLQAYLNANMHGDDDWQLDDAFDATKLRKLHTSKHVISGQFHTDGVRVIFPMRTPTAAAGHVAKGAASGAARSEDGMRQCVADNLPPADLVAYDAQRAAFNQASQKTTAGKAARKIAKAASTAIWKRARAAAEVRKKEAEKQSKKRKRDDAAAADATAQGVAKRAKSVKARADPKAKTAHITTAGFTHVTGVDTGNANPVYAARYPVNAPPPARPVELYHVTLGEWRTETGQRRRSRELNKAVKAAKLPQLGTLHTADIEWLATAMAERLASYDRFYGVYGSVKQRKLAFDGYMKKQKALVKVAKRLIPDKTTVLAWGDGKFPHNMRGHAPGVGKTIERFLKVHYATHMRVTPEHNTSCLCANCHKPNKTMVHGIALRRNGQPARVGRVATGALIPRTIHGLLQCTNCHTRWNRDVNGAINIAHVFFSIAAHPLGRAPLPFRRGAP